jgi:hypothetical protein
MSDRFDLSKRAKSSFGEDNDVYASISGSKSGGPHTRNGVEEVIPPLHVRPKGGVGDESRRDSMTSVDVNIHYDATPATNLNRTLQEPDTALLPQASVRDTAFHHIHRIPTDYEVFLAKSQADYEMHTQRNYRTTQLDQESLANKTSPLPKDDHHLSSFRTCLRVSQVLMR